MTANSQYAGVEQEAALAGLLCDLPTFRPVALKMLKVLSREESNFAEVTRVLEADPGFAAEILAVANSTLYAGHSQVNTLLRAIVVLGSERVKSLTMTVAMRAFLRNLPHSEELQRSWSHSRACALLAEDLAAAYNVPSERAYIAGLMHDVGRFGLLAGSAEDYAGLLNGEYDAPAAVLEAERQRFGFDHCRAGEMLVRTWRLPDEFARVAAGHHGEEAAGNTGALALVRAACPLASSLGFPSVAYRAPAGLEEIVASLPGQFGDAESLAQRLQKRFQTLDLG